MQYCTGVLPFVYFVVSVCPKIPIYLNGKVKG